jgi:hypothetical protein
MHVAPHTRHDEDFVLRGDRPLLPLVEKLQQTWSGSRLHEPRQRTDRMTAHVPMPADQQEAKEYRQIIATGMRRVALLTPPR